MTDELQKRYNELASQVEAVESLMREFKAKFLLDWYHWEFTLDDLSDTRTVYVMYTKEYIPIMSLWGNGLILPSEMPELRAWAKANNAVVAPWSAPLE